MRRHHGNHWVALLAAYVLLAQALFGVLAPNASAASVQFDAAGQVICTGSGEQQLPGAPEPGGHHHLPDCCLTGCNMFSPAFLPVPDMAGIRLPRAEPAPSFAAEPWIHHALRRDGSPANPRAPPAAA